MLYEEASRMNKDDAVSRKCSSSLLLFKGFKVARKRCIYSEIEVIVLPKLVRVFGFQKTCVSALIK